jgi:hypothetical protein
VGTLAAQIRSRRQDLQVKIRQQVQSKPPQSPPTPQSWQETTTRPRKNLFEGLDPLEARFREMEMEEELEALKRKLS